MERTIVRRRALLLGVLAIAGTRALAQTAPPPAGQPTPAAPPAAETPAGSPPPDLRRLEAGPVLRRRVAAGWDEGFDALRKAFAGLEAEAGKAGLAVAGRPRLHFLEGTDTGFTFEALLPLAAAPAAGAALAAGIESALSPAGRVVVFPYEGPYDDIDSAYEAYSAYLEEKGLTATGTFIEEYLVLPEKSDDPSLRVTIYAFLK